MRKVAEEQRKSVLIQYHRIPLRESTTPRTMVDLLRKANQFSQDDSIAYHIDIGHIIPANANTTLFELLLIRLIREADSCRVFHRDTNLIFYLEIPNSVPKILIILSSGLALIM